MDKLPWFYCWCFQLVVILLVVSYWLWFQNGNASRAKCMPKDAKQQDSTPILSKTIVKRSCENMTLERNGSSSETHNTPSCDYTTKLFRKEVLSHTPRTLMAKDRKQSLWVQPPEADELSCSLLSDDSKLDRPERLKSLLACVSGKGVFFP